VCHRRTVLLHQFRPTATTTDRRNVLSLTSIHWALLSLTVLPAVLARFSFTTRNVFLPPLKPRYVRNERCPRSRWRDDHGRPRARHWTCIGDRRRRHRRPRTGRSRERTHAESRPLGRRHRVRRRRDRRGRPADTDRRAASSGKGPTPASSSPPSHNPRPTTGSSSGRPTGGHSTKTKTTESPDRRGSGVQPRRVGRTRRAPPRRRRTRAPRAKRSGESVAIPDDLSVVVDLGNGVGRVTADALHATGCDVETLNAQRDGRFPGRPSEPTAENCQTACVVVEATDADLGIVHDGDADRMMAIDERGQFVSGDALLALFGRREADAGDRVAVPVDEPPRRGHARRGRCGRDVHPVGDAYVAAETANPGVVFGGEPSGGMDLARADALSRRAPRRLHAGRAGRRGGIAVGDGRRASRVPDSAGFGADGREGGGGRTRRRTRPRAVRNRLDARRDSRETDAGWFLVRASVPSR